MRRFLALAVACGSAQPTAQAPATDHALHVVTDYETGAVHTKITGHDVAVGDLPLADLIGIAMTGRGEVDVDVRVPVANGQRDYRAATGDITLSCTACAIASYTPHLKNPRSQAMVGTVQLGVAIDRLEAHATIAGGKVHLASWKLGSADLRVDFTLDIDLAERFDDSTVTGCLRFGATDALGKRDPRAAGMLGLTGAPLAPDHLYNVRLVGTAGELRALPQVCDGSAPPQPVDEPPTKPELADTATDDLSAELDKAIVKKSDTDYEIRKDLIDKLLADPVTASKGARIVPAVKNGQPDGFKLYAIRPSSVYAKLGLENGDTIHEVNGFALTSADKALEAYTKLRDATSIELTLTRRGKPVTLRYTIK